jgi:hypothetical protein
MSELHFPRTAERYPARGRAAAPAERLVGDMAVLAEGIESDTSKDRAAVKVPEGHIPGGAPRPLPARFEHLRGTEQEPVYNYLAARWEIPGEKPAAVPVKDAKTGKTLLQFPNSRRHETQYDRGRFQRP